MADFQLHRSLTLPYPRPRVFDFFSRAENLDLLTPPWLHFAILTPLPVVMGKGTVIRYRIRLRGVPVGWTSEITCWEPPLGFTDRQTCGPYRSWVHCHWFDEVPGGTVATDVVTYSVFGGWLVNRLFVAGELRKIFDYREARREIFPLQGRPIA